jgi:hypothetical protein
MRALILVAALTIVPAADESTYTVVVELGNVCGRECVAILEAALGRIDGVREAKMYGDKFHFSLSVLENKSVLPSTILRMVEKIKTDSKGEEDFPLEEFVATLSGTVEKQGDASLFTARGTSQNFSFKANDEPTRILAAGKTRVTLTGKVTQAKDKALPLIEVAEAKETPK